VKHDGAAVVDFIVTDMSVTVCDDPWLLSVTVCDGSSLAPATLCDGSLLASVTVCVGGPIFYSYTSTLLLDRVSQNKTTNLLRLSLLWSLTVSGWCLSRFVMVSVWYLSRSVMISGWCLSRSVMVSNGL
jgi:hypothetical protein